MGKGSVWSARSKFHDPGMSLSVYRRHLVSMREGRVTGLSDRGSC